MMWAAKQLLVNCSQINRTVLLSSLVNSSRFVNQISIRCIESGISGSFSAETQVRSEIVVKRDHLGYEFKKSFETRKDLVNAKRIVVKLGSAVITREDECGLALGRLASIVEQVSQLHNDGKDVLMVTSGAVAFGKQKLFAEKRMSMSMRETLSPKEIKKGVTAPLISVEINAENSGEASNPEPRAAAAVGQSGLMALYDAMFTQYGVNIAQVLLTRNDLIQRHSRENLRTTILELLKLHIIPIINTNDAVAPPGEQGQDLTGILSIQDNDSLASHISVEVGADTLLLMSDVNGIYTKPPSQEGARLLHTYSPSNNGVVTYGRKSRVGMGGMESKVSAAGWALERGVATVICNGMEDQAINKIMSGKRIGTFFTQEKHNTIAVETLAANARKGSRVLQSLSPEQRSDIILRIAESLKRNKDRILAVNKHDLNAAEASGLPKPLLSRLSLSEAKLNSLSDGLVQIAIQSHQILGQCLRHTLIADGLELKQITVPLGVLLVIFESRPDCMPQVAALSIATANGLLAKGGKEATRTNTYLYDLIREALSHYDGAENALGLVSNREDVSELLQLDNYIDLIIPRGSNELVRNIQEQSKSIPVLGHSEGICHVYVDRDADLHKAVKIVRDSKCDYPSACNAMETLLLHRDIVESEVFVKICNKLKEEGVNIYAGPQMAQMLTFGPPIAKSMRTEYGSLDCTIEVVNDVREAIEHINNFGSGHTDVIVTENEEASQLFTQKVDSACVFHNCSTRFADGYRFGLGAEVGISTSRVHARGPVGMQGLLSTKWILEGDGNAVTDFTTGAARYKHESLPINQNGHPNDVSQEVTI